MRGSCIFCCSSCNSFNPTSHLKHYWVEQMLNTAYKTNLLTLVKEEHNNKLHFFEIIILDTKWKRK